MDDVGALETLAEFGIALAGFTGIVIAFRRGEGSFHPIDELRVFMALVPSLMGAFLALLPVGLELVGLSSSSKWLAAGLVHAGATIAVGIAIGVRMRGLPSRDSTIISRRLTIFFYLAISLSIVVNLVSATSEQGLPPSGTYFFAVLLLLANGALVFVRLMFIRPRD